MTVEEIRTMERESVKLDPRTVDGLIEKFLPGAMDLFYPRKYAAPGGYTSPKVPARMFAMTTSRPDIFARALDGTPFAGTVTDQVAAAGLRLAQFKMPTFWVARDLAEAAVHTAPPETLKLADVKFPLDALMFLLPENSFDPPGQKASWIGVACNETVKHNRLVTFVSGGLGPTYVVTLNPEQPLSQFDAMPFQTPHPETGEDVAGLTTPEDGAFTRRMCHLGTTLLMLMNARPELVVVDTPSDSEIGNGGRAGRNKLFRPNWVGRDYRVVRKSGEGTHASPTLHWRRGHWRHQAFGPQRRERKDIWIEPCIVGHE
jgi:hypothetical protein